MSASNFLSKLRRATPQVVNCFRGAQLYHRQRAASDVYPPELIVLFTWLGAKQKYAYKYANCWTQRGHDVLHITTSVRDLLFPKTGAEVTASRVVDFLDKYDKSVIIHGLSVGSYLTQRVLLQARDATFRVTHQMFDSFTTCSGIEAGVENAVNPRYRDIAKKSVKLYTKCADLSSINEAQRFALTTPCPAPIMFIHSLADKVAPYSEVVPIINAATKVCPVRLHIIPEEENIPHVTIMKCLGEEKYMGMLYDFIEEYREPGLMGCTSEVKSSSPGGAESPNIAALS
ncbi:uncharacterized protein [Macrobrachium rosenbergii]|uniref:uncharacterized protein n=1 Tax=Macrobrachium rosenbergii TaxID=79674 RepID=UPI0034D782F1